MNQKINPTVSLEQISNPEQQIHLSDYLNIIWRRKWVVIIVFLLVVSIVTLKSFYVVPTYTATTQIIIEKQGPQTVGEGVLPMNIGDKEYYQTQYNLLHSRDLIQRVIEDVNLKEYVDLKRKTEKKDILDLGFKKVKKIISSFLLEVKKFFIESSSDSDSSAIFSEPFRNQSEHDLKDENPLVNWYLSRLQINPIPDSRLVNIIFEETSPKMTAVIANSHARAFIDKNYKDQTTTSQETLDWFSQQLKKQRSKVESSRRDVHDFKSEQNLVSLGGSQNIVAQKLLELNTSLTKAKMDRMSNQVTYDQLLGFSMENQSIFSLPEVVADSVIQGLRNRWLDLKIQRQRLVTEYENIHPDLVEIDSDIALLGEEMAREVQRLSQTIKTKLERADFFERSLEMALDEQKQAALSLSEKNIRHDVLDREAESNQDLYKLLLEQFENIGLTSSFEGTNIRIIDKAEIPRLPEDPRTALNILLSMGLSLFMGAGLALFFEYMDDSVKSPEDVFKHLGMPLIGTLPYDKSLKRSGKKSLPYIQSMSEQRDNAGNLGDYSYANNLMSLQTIRPGKLGRTILIESATSGEGKTTVLAKSALDLSNAGFRVLMIETDHHRPTLLNLFGFGEDEADGGLISAMEDVLSNTIHAGGLSDYSVDDLFFLIALKKQNGQLCVTENSQEMMIRFENGCPIHIQSENSPLTNRLGATLLRGGFITEEQLEDALDRHKRTGKPLGYILVNAGYIAQNQLRGPLKLHMEENLQKLFSWKSGTFLFKPEAIEKYEDERICFAEDYSPIIDHLGHMAGNCLLERAALSYVQTGIQSNLSILPTGSGLPGSIRLYGKVYLMILEKFLDILKQRYDLIFMDAPPLLEMGGATGLATLADGVVMVTKAGHLSVKVLNEATANLRETKANILGVILNQATMGRNLYVKY